MPEQSAPHGRPESAESGSSARLSLERGLGPTSDAGFGDEVHLLDYVRVLYKRRWMAATIFLVVILSVTVYTFTATPIYEARVKILIESDTPNFVNFQQVIEEGQAQANYYETQYDILESRALARKTLETAQLWTHPAFAGEDAVCWQEVRGIGDILDPPHRPVHHGQLAGCNFVLGYFPRSDERVYLCGALPHGCVLHRLK